MPDVFCSKAYIDWSVSVLWPEMSVSFWTYFFVKK